MRKRCFHDGRQERAASGQGDFRCRRKNGGKRTSGASASSTIRNGCSTNSRRICRQLIALCENEMRDNAIESDKKLLYPAQEFPDPGQARPARPARAEGAGRHGREPCLRRHGGRDHRPLRLPVDRHVLHHAYRRGRGRAVPPPRQPAACRTSCAASTRTAWSARSPIPIPRPARISGIRFPPARRRSRRLEGAQEGLLDHLGRLRRLVHRADHQPEFRRQLLRPLLLADPGQRGQGRAREVGRPRPARQPVGHARGRTSVVPQDRLVGPNGDGAKSNDECVDPFFLLCSSACWNGISLALIDIAKRHTTRKKHVDVGMRVADYPTIQDYVGEAIIDTNACRSFVFHDGAGHGRASPTIATGRSTRISTPCRAPSSCTGCGR